MAAPRPSFSAAEMLTEMDAIGVDRAVVVPPVWAGDHNETALAAAAAHPDRFAVMGRFDPFVPNARDELERLWEQPHLLGLRMSGRWGMRPTSFLEAVQDGSLDWFWSACEGLEIPLMCLALRCPEVLAPVAERHPSLTLIVDHMAGVGPPTDEGSAEVLRSLLDLARFPNVLVKVSGAPNRSREPYPFRDMHAALRSVYDAFGPGRMMWAADVTQLTKNTYGECLALWREGLPFLSENDRGEILGGTAARALNWPETVGTAGRETGKAIGGQAG